MEYLGLGAEIAASVAIPILVGYFLDTYFDTFPWISLGGIALGMILFLMTVMRISNKLNTPDED